MQSKKYLHFGFRLVIMCGSLYLILSIVDIRALGRSLVQIPLWAFVSACFIAVFRIWLTGIRWRTINPNLSAQISDRQYFFCMMASSTFNMFMPGALGGDVARSVIVYKTVESERAINVMSIFVDRIIGFASIITLGIIACLFSLKLPGLPQYILILLICLVALVSITLFSLSKKLISIIEKFLKPFGAWGKKIIHLLNIWHEMICFYKKYPSRVVIALLLCIPIHISWFVVMYILANINGIEISFFTIAIITSLVWIITAIPITFSGMGVRELSFVYLLSLQGISPEAATTLSLHQFAITVLMAIIGIPFIWLANIKKTHEKKNTI